MSLVICDLTKRFGYTTVLEGVSLEVRPGEVHAIVGENGAGKSTLIKILAGVYQPDAGRIVFDGREVRLSAPHEAHDAGIAVIHQERQLVPALSGLENLFLGAPCPRRGALVDWAAMRRRAAQVQDELGIHVPLHLPARQLPPAEQTWLEILRAGLTASKVLLLDEPTAALTGHAAGQLFALIRRLQGQGTAFVYVSHRLEEVRAIADRVTVLRNGRWAGEVRASAATTEELVALITGQDAAGTPTGARPLPEASAAPLLDVRDLATRDGRVRRASVTLRAGEVVGLFGLAGAGRTEMIEAVYGLRPLESGEIWVRGARLRRLDPQAALRAGVAMVPEDRRAAGLIPRHSVRENMTLPILDRYCRWGLIRHRAELGVVRRQIDALNIRTEGPHQPIEHLSGGNQQKVLLARTLLAGPAVLLCDEPTHAVDVRTRQTIHQLLHERARDGCAVLFSSSDLDEVLAVAGRIVLMAAGCTVSEVNQGEYDAAEIMRRCYAATEAEQPVS